MRYKVDTNPSIEFNVPGAMLYPEAENVITLEITLPGNYLTIELEDIDVTLYEWVGGKEHWKQIDNGNELMDRYMGVDPEPDDPREVNHWGKP